MARRPTPWMVVGFGIMAGAAACAADGEPTPEPPGADFAKWCGHEEPTRLVATTTDESIGSTWSVRPDLWGVFVDRCRDESCEVPEVDAVFFDACGERNRVPVDVQLVYRHDDAPHDVVLVCDHNGHVAGIDPDESVTSLVLTGVGCQAAPVGAGVAGLQPIGGQTARIVLRTSVEALDAPMQLLAEDALWPGADARPWNGTATIRGGEDALLYLAANGDLVEVEIASNERRVLIDDVAAFDVSANFRWIVVQGSVPFVEGLSNYPLLLLDREGDDVVELGWGSVSDGMWPIRSGYVVAAADPAFGGDRITLLPELDQLMLGADRSVVRRIDDGRLIIADEAGLSFYDPVTHEQEPLFPNPSAYPIGVPGGFDMLDFGSGAGEAGLDLFHVSNDGSTAHLVGGFDAYARIDAAHVVVVPHRTTAHSDLVLVDTTSGQRTLVDSDAVLPGDMTFGRWPPLLGEGTLVYEVLDEDRRGLWVASFD